MKPLSLLIALFLAQLSFSQDMIFLLNGGILEGKVKGVEDGEIIFDVSKGSKTKTRTVEAARVFSVVKADGSEEIFYQKDIESGFFFEKEQMKHFVFGAQDAVKYYKGNLHLFTAGFAGAVGGFLFYNSFLVLAAPFGAAIVGSIGKAHPRKSMVRDLKYLDDPAYVLGFERTANSKKVMRSLLGAVTGIAAGAAAGWAVDWNPQ